MIYFFLGDFNPDPKQWLLDPHLAGHSGIFASTRERIDGGGCGNCKAQEEAGLKYADTVPLTAALLHFYESAEEVYGLKVTSMAPESVVPFLTRNMHWRILKVCHLTPLILLIPTLIGVVPWRTRSSRGDALAQGQRVQREGASALPLVRHAVV